MSLTTLLATATTRCWGLTCQGKAPGNGLKPPVRPRSPKGDHDPQGERPQTGVPELRKGRWWWYEFKEGWPDRQLSGLVRHVNNLEDPIPIVPDMSLGFHQRRARSIYRILAHGRLAPVRFFSLPLKLVCSSCVYVWCGLGSIDRALTLCKLFRSGQFFQVVHRQRCEQHLLEGNLERSQRAIRRDYHTMPTQRGYIRREKKKSSDTLKLAQCWQIFLLRIWDYTNAE
jgi:hypothetical protein